MNDSDRHQLRLTVSGPRACFRRPEFASDFVTYDVLPPPVARQIIKATAGPGWTLQCIRVCRPIRFAWDHVATGRGERRALILTDVEYALEAEGPSPIALTGISNGPAVAHLGLEDYPGAVKLLGRTDQVVSTLEGSGRIDLGWMAYDAGRPHPRFFRASMIDGAIAVSPQDAMMLAS